MRSHSNVVGAAVGMVAVVVTVGFTGTGCAKTATGTPVADPGAAASTTPSSATSTAMPSAQAAPVGSAVMSVTGGSGTVTIRYRINGGPEQTETNVTLPWEKQYSVYDELESEVTADGGDASLICSITMDGDKLVSFKSEPRPTCNFAYWG
ncbi:hypothetical protein KL953_01290 [Mycolicibacterium goodii]|uniref:hypothetical protein n=1 Tax=Mycolicibacterium goodii TaxID=134601 RepID=UPI001BDC302A|nr:hypothetical protein [Mycolicibacterium goodii]MBU8807524.1 hypothetical protein [Mycolicibacterium goodii]